jgi:alpha-L-fucosidase
LQEGALGETLSFYYNSFPQESREMKSTIIALLCFAALFPGHLTAQESASKDKAESRMDWFRQAKFGMFIHWGVYSMAAGEWNGETDHAEWLQLTAKIPLAEYTEYAKDFNPKKFDADRWVKIVKDAGMQYLVITSKHHDGFAMFDSACSDHNVVDGTAFKRDPLKELSQACARHGIRFCVYYSLGRDWQDPDVPTGRGEKKGFRSNLIDFPKEDEKVFARYFQRKVKPQVRELLTDFGPIGIFWFDTYGLISKEESTELKQIIRELQPDCIINARIGHKLGDYKVSEQEIPADGSFEPWESCMTMNKHWSYNRADDQWKTTKKLLHNLIDIVSKGGNFLLNVGPTGEGEIPEPSVDRLVEIGAWLKTNGEAVYGCGPTPFGEELKTKATGKSSKKEVTAWKWRATTKPGQIFVHVFEWPRGSLVLPAVSEKIVSVAMLGGDNGELDFEQDSSGVKITLPKAAPDEIASVIRIKLDSKP